MPRKKRKGNENSTSGTSCPLQFGFPPEPFGKEKILRSDINIEEPTVTYKQHLAQSANTVEPWNCFGSLEIIKPHALFSLKRSVSHFSKELGSGKVETRPEFFLLSFLSLFLFDPSDCPDSLAEFRDLTHSISSKLKAYHRAENRREVASNPWIGFKFQ